MPVSPAPKHIDTGSLRLAYLEAGSGGPLVLLLHGFPDSAWSFRPVMEHLAAQGLRAVAPFQRGYAPSDLAPDGDYRVTALADDVLGLMDALGADHATVVGHDWGAAAAYLTATRAPERVATLVTAAVPHLRRFLLKPTRRQLWRSRYMFRFQLPGAEKRFARPGVLEALVREWSPGWDFTDEDLAPLHAMLREPARARAMITYYRDLRRTLRNPKLLREALAPLPVATTLLAGADDGCIGLECFSDQEALFPAGLDLQVLPGAGHFMHCEQPDVFAERVLGAMAAR